MNRMMGGCGGAGGEVWSDATDSVPALRSGRREVEDAIKHVAWHAWNNRQSLL